MASSVKFIQIKGTPEDYTLSEYQAKLAEARSIPGAIIFGLYVKPGSPKIHYELWANDQQYSIGGGGDTKVQTGTCEPWEFGTHAGETWPNDFDRGSFYIKINDVNETKNGNEIVNTWTLTGVTQASLTNGENSDNIANKTAYVFVGESSSDLQLQAKWYALSGNYNAENVYFPHGVQRTCSIGVQEKSGDAIVIDGVNQNLTGLLEYYLVKEVWPTASLNPGSLTTSDTWSVSFKNSTPSSLSVTANGSSISSDKYVLYGSVIAATGTYKPEIQASNGPTTFEYSANTISNLINGYADATGSSAPYTVGTKHTGAGTDVVSGTEVTGTFVYANAVTPQECTSQISFTNSADEVSRGTKTTNASGEAPSITYNQADQNPSGPNNYKAKKLGDLTISLTNTNTSKHTRSVSGTWPSVIPATDRIFVLSNKGNAGESTEIQGDVSITLPGLNKSLPSNTISNTNKSETLHIYCPTYDNFSNSQASHSSTLTAGKKCTGSNLTYEWTSKWDGNDTTRLFIIEVPKGYTVSQMKINNSNANSVLTDAYTIESITAKQMFTDGPSLKYNRITTKWTFAAGASCKIVLASGTIEEQS